MEFDTLSFAVVEVERLRAENERLRDVIRPFAETACRLGWNTIPDDSMELDEHVMEAPAEDIAPGAVYCLMISAFRNAAIESKG